MISLPDDATLPADLQAVLTRLYKKLKTQSPIHEKLSMTERGVIKLLNDHAEMLPSQLAKMEQVSTQSMSQILSHLSEIGYVTRRPFETDKRKVMIALSEGGRAMIGTIRGELNTWLSKAIRDTCSAEDQVVLRQAIGPLTRLLNVD